MKIKSHNDNQKKSNTLSDSQMKILQALATLLENPIAEKITVALLASRAGCSEGNLYKLFDNKTHIFQCLIDFIEHSLLGLINQITNSEEDALRQIEQIIYVALSFAEKNPGMTRVMIGEALSHESIELQKRMSSLIDKLEAALRQSLRIYITQNSANDIHVAAIANLIRCFLIGAWEQYVRSGFKNSPLNMWLEQKNLFYLLLR